MFDFEDEQFTTAEATPPPASPLSWFHKAPLAIVFWPWIYVCALIVPEQLWPVSDSKIWIHLLIALALTLLAGRPIWRWLMRGRYRAGTVFGTLGLSPILILIFAWGSGELPNSFEEFVAEIAAIEIDNANARIASLQSLVEPTSAASVAAPAQSPEIAATSFNDYSHTPQYQLAATSHRKLPTDSFSSCITEIYAGEPSMRKEALIKLSRPATISHLAEDIVQKTILSVCEKAASREEPLDELRPYFFRAITYAHIDVKRNQRRWNTCDFDETLNPTTPDRQYDALEKIRLVHQALCEMPEQTAHALRMTAAGYSHREIAEELDISYDLSRKLVSDGRKALREITNLTFH